MRYQLLDLGMPFSTTAPLVFHHLFSLPEDDRGRQMLLALLGADATLSPRGDRSGDWSSFGAKRVSKFDIRDQMAGDGRFLFFSVCRPLSGPEPIGLEGGYVPTLAFDLDDLASRGNIGWRPHDLFASYGHLMERKRGSATRDLQRLARLATVPDPEIVRKLVALEALVLAEPVRARAIEDEAYDVVLRRQVAASRRAPSAIDWVAPFRLRYEAEEDAAGPPGFPVTLRSQATSEVLLEGRLPLRRARFMFAGNGATWERLPSPR